MAIADVADRKVPATLLMAVSRTILHSLTETREDPQVADIVEYLNRLINEKNKMNASLTLFYAIIDTAKKNMDFVNAGHSSPLLFKLRDKKIITLTKDDVLLGSNKKVELTTNHTDLDAGDVLVFHTDGIYSVANQEGQNLGYEFTEKILSENHQLGAEQLIDKYKDEIFKFHGNDDLTDDISLIIVKIN